MFCRNHIFSFVALFLIAFAIADVSMTGWCCQDSDDPSLAQQLPNNGVTSSSALRHACSSGRCFCCSTLLAPTFAVQLEGLRSQKVLLVSEGLVRTSQVHPDIYHPPKTA